MVAILFPWAIIFADDNPLGGFLAMALQTTLIGWIPASIWAWKIVHRNPQPVEPVATPSEPTPKKTRSNSSTKANK